MRKFAARLGLMTLFLAFSLQITGCGRDSETSEGGPSSEDGGPYQGVGPGMGKEGTGAGGQGSETDTVGKPEPRGTTR